MFFVEKERAGNNLLKSFNAVESEKSKIKTRPQYTTRRTQ
jgi:hypothetical protein